MKFGEGSPLNGYRFTNTADDHGVNHDGDGLLYGYAWSANIGWIYFGWALANDPNAAKVDLLIGNSVAMHGLPTQVGSASAPTSCAPTRCAVSTATATPSATPGNSSNSATSAPPASAPIRMATAKAMPPNTSPEPPLWMLTPISKSSRTATTWTKPKSPRVYLQQYATLHHPAHRRSAQSELLERFRPRVTGRIHRQHHPVLRHPRHYQTLFPHSRTAPTQ